jgi:hypothetical protein
MTSRSVFIPGAGPAVKSLISAPALKRPFAPVSTIAWMPASASAASSTGTSTVQ